jgi:hydroxymethylpyrimidine/phosphomethylpyrimidine kinase
MRRAAAMIREQGAAAVLIKGGHLREVRGRRQEAGEIATDESMQAIDVLDNQGQVTVFRERRISGGELHGSGCILSAAIAAGLGKGMTLEDSVGAAKRFVFEAISEASNGG